MFKRNDFFQITQYLKIRNRTVRIYVIADEDDLVDLMVFDLFPGVASVNVTDGQDMHGNVSLLGTNYKQLF